MPHLTLSYFWAGSRQLVSYSASDPTWRQHFTELAALGHSPKIIYANHAIPTSREPDRGAEGRPKDPRPAATV
jgi:hypothetical protein